MRFRRPGHWRTRWVLVVALVCAPLAAFAQVEESIRVTWRDAAGPVVGYDVYVGIDGLNPALFSFTPENEVEISGAAYQRGDALRVQVVAVASDGRRGRPSELSDVIFFVSPPAPQGVMPHGGSPASPNSIEWSAIDYVDFYVVFRSEDPSDIGSLLAATEDTRVEDFEAELDVTYYYSVAAIKGHQVSEFSPGVPARRATDPPSLQATPASLTYTAAPGEVSATQALQLGNSGDVPISYTAWPTVPWLQVTSSAGTVDPGGQLTLNVSYDLASLEPGQHGAGIALYTYYQPAPGAELVGGPLVVVPVSVTIPVLNSPPVIDSPSWITMMEGEVRSVTISASDPDPGESVALEVGSLPGFATFQSLGGGVGEILLAPNFASAGFYQATVQALNASGQATRTLTILVQNVNRAPVVGVVPDTTIRVGELSTVVIQAFDPDGDRLAISSSAVADFVTLTDFGNGTAVFSFEPTAADVGNYMIVVAVVDDGAPPGASTTSFVLIVE